MAPANSVNASQPHIVGYMPGTTFAFGPDYKVFSTNDFNYSSDPTGTFTKTPEFGVKVTRNGDQVNAQLPHNVNWGSGSGENNDEGERRQTPFSHVPRNGGRGNGSGNEGGQERRDSSHAQSGSSENDVPITRENIESDFGTEIADLYNHILTLLQTNRVAKSNFEKYVNVLSKQHNEAMLEIQTKLLDGVSTIRGLKEEKVALTVEHEERIRQLQSEIGAAKNAAQGSEAALRACEQKFEAQAGELAICKSSIDQQTELYSTYQEEIRKVTKERNDLSSNHEQFQQQTKVNTDHLNEQIETLTTELNDCRAQLTQQATNSEVGATTILHRQIETLRTENERLNRTKKELHDQIEALTTEITTRIDHRLPIERKAEA